jgi:hypothetical protein
MRTALAILLSVIAAFAFSFAIDLLLGALFGVYPDTAFLPVVTRSVISVLAVIGAVKVASLRGWLAVPFVAFSALALFGAVVGTHPHSFGVGAILLIQAAIVWFICRRTTKNIVSGNNATRRSNRLAHLYAPISLTKHPALHGTAALQSA